MEVGRGRALPFREFRDWRAELYLGTSTKVEPVLEALHSATYGAAALLAQGPVSHVR